MDAITRRREVWSALSDLYLDTDTSLLYPQIAEALARSPYSSDEIWRILRHEVHPAVSANMRDVAGVWDGFDTEWLAARIQRRLSRPAWRRPFGCVFCGQPRQEWRILASLIDDARRRLESSA